MPSIKTNRGVRSKLHLASLIVLALLAVLTLTAYGGMRRQQAALHDIYQVRFATHQRTVDIRRDATATYAGIYRLLSWAGAGAPANASSAAPKRPANLLLSAFLFILLLLCRRTSVCK